MKQTIFIPMKKQDGQLKFKKVSCGNQNVGKIKKVYHITHLCNGQVLGDEVHCLLECTDANILSLRTNLYIKKIIDVSPQLEYIFDDCNKMNALSYLLLGHEELLLPFFWMVQRIYKFM